mgnify:CR=1 FL=1
MTAYVQHRDCSIERLVRICEISFSHFACTKSYTHDSKNGEGALAVDMAIQLLQKDLVMKNKGNEERSSDLKQEKANE